MKDNAVSDTKNSETAAPIIKDTGIQQTNLVIILINKFLFIEFYKKNLKNFNVQ